jgi:hypothetical protein
MITSHAKLLTQLHEYVDEYIDYMSIRPEQSLVEANEELRKIIAELESLQAHPDQRAEAARLSQRIEDQIGHLNMLMAQVNQRQRRTAPSRPKQTLAQAFQSYLSTEIDYLLRSSGGARREQCCLLLGDVIADLKALALHPTDEQALQLAADLEAKRTQLRKLERPWQQIEARAS